ncbi:hypothetical protein ACH4FX_40295 [Streptomyces sp. NPDC018019]|uniref:hypothetical protein n=1 Tax=Streptomyces sp. NPDC018019 TaxID=3365030 RepID=UPI0037B2F378
MSELVHTAVTCQPLHTVARLIDLLEQSPHGKGAADEALRTAATELPVYEVAQLVHLLTQPPRPYDGADRLLCTAAEQRPIAEVSHLMTLLHKPPHATRSGSETTRTAAGRRTVEELVQLINTLMAERTESSAAETCEQTATLMDSSDGHAEQRDAKTRHFAAEAWLPRIAGAGLLVCGAAHIPLGLRGSSPLVTMIVAIGLPALCVLLAAGLFIKATVIPLAAGAAVAAAAVALHLLSSGLISALPFPDVLRGTLLPPLPASAAAGLAALLTLAALAHKAAVSRSPEAAAAQSVA